MTKHAASWRDPAGFVWRSGERIFRAVVPDAMDMLRQLLDEPWFQARVASGVVPRTWWLAEDETSPNHPLANQYVWLEHEALSFPCYPHEITALQLYDSAKLTLSLAREALAHGWVLKDASAWNVLFDNGKPVFCDILSFERLRQAKGSGIWVAYAQYCRHFVIPLLLYRDRQLPPSGQFLTYRDGVTPERAQPMLKGLSAWRQPALEIITLPKLLAKKGRVAIASAGSQSDKPVSPELEAYLLGRMFNRLEKHLEAVNPKLAGNETVWSGYEATRDHYINADIAAKHSFVRQALVDSPGETVLDLGCNAGEFSLLAAEQGKQVVAADFDDGALTKLYNKLRIHPANVSPILLDVGRPTPAIGWMNQEVPSFLDRAKGKFDCVMALGLMHHLLVTERVPLQLILNLLLSLQPKALIVEWIESKDTRFVELVGLNASDQKLVSAAEFEAVFAKHYRLVRKQRLPSRDTRSMYFWLR